MPVDLALMLQPVRLFRINKATERVKGMLRELLAFELQGGLLRQPLPSSAFEDPYVFGYLGAVAMFAADLVSLELKNGMSVDDKARVARGAVIALSGMGAKRYHSVNEDITRHMQEFVDGTRQAQRMLAVMHGEVSAADNPEVVEAFKVAVKLPDGTAHTAAVAAAMKDAHLGQRLKILREQDHSHRSLRHN